MNFNGNVTASWKQVGALAAAIIVGSAAIGGGAFGLLNLRVSDTQSGIVGLRADLSGRISGREEEDRDIRGVIERSNEALRLEISKLGDRLVESNRDLATQINKMGDDVISTMKDGDDRLERRFDSLETKFDSLLTRISYETIELPEGITLFLIDKDGYLQTPDGNTLGTLPAVLRQGN